MQSKEFQSQCILYIGSFSFANYILSSVGIYLILSVCAYFEVVFALNKRKQSSKCYFFDNLLQIYLYLLENAPIIDYFA